jgi:hypothetical protein
MKVAKATMKRMIAQKNPTARRCCMMPRQTRWDNVLPFLARIAMTRKRASSTITATRIGGRYWVRKLLIKPGFVL